MRCRVCDCYVPQSVIEKNENKCVFCQDMFLKEHMRRENRGHYIEKGYKFNVGKAVKNDVKRV